MIGQCSVDSRGRRSGLAVAALAAIGSITLSAPVMASPVDGSWEIRDLVLDIFSCQNAVCGKIAWTKDPQLRRRDCGKTIVWGLSSAGPRSWSGGSIYDTTDGNTYSLSATLQPDGTLQARIYRGIPMFGKTETLTKVRTKSLSGWCAS